MKPGNAPNFWHRLLHQPQKIWLRKANFQVHLWAGIGAGLYIFVVCVTGSALVFRPEMTRAYQLRRVIVPGSGEVLTDEEIRQVVGIRYPGYELRDIDRKDRPDAAVHISIQRGNDKKFRMLDPFTGKDLGPQVPFVLRALQWLVDLHDNLVAGKTGRFVNGAGGFLTVLMTLTGAVVWWPGVKNWRRSLGIHRGVNWKRFVWDFHSAFGFWTLLFVLMWGLSGFYLVFQEWLSPILDFIEPSRGTPFQARYVDVITEWLSRLHFGRFRGLRSEFNLTFKVIWVVLGLAPPVLFITGGLMWWNRKVRRSQV
ncbi:MAG TPA: PepSY-associated TM helix domain-containing protein [Terriglobia bacterium]|nr:PepSY-associated TM helix domain-containing protein [Terriglobia bacterium]